MKCHFKQLIQLSLVIFSACILSCGDDNTLPTVDKNKITQPFYVQFDMIDEQTGDSIRVTRQYRTLFGETQSFIDSTCSQARIAATYQTEDDASADMTPKRMSIIFLTTIRIPLDSLKKAKNSYRDSLCRNFELKSYPYSTMDTAIKYNYSDGILMYLGDNLSTIGQDSAINKSNKSYFSITTIEPLDTSASPYTYQIKGTFNCKLEDKVSKKIFTLKNGKFSSLAVQTARYY